VSVGSATVGTPSARVLAAIQAGSPTIPAIAQQAGLDPGVARLVVDRLVAGGHLRRDRLSAGCPTTGCGACPTARGTGGGDARAGTTCPVVLAISRR
jgi:hypothetical protein